MKYLALALSLATFSTPALAAPITYTGAEFANLPGIAFPTGVRTIIGDSLRIEATDNNSAIAILALDQFDVDVGDFEVDVNITRIIADDGRLDQNLFIHLSDGRNLFGGVFVDNIPSVSAQIRRDELSSDGQSLMIREELGSSPSILVDINNSYLATIKVQATNTNTTVRGYINNGISATNIGVTSTLFDSRNGGPSLVLSSNDFNHNYLINSVTFTRGVNASSAVTEPGALGGLALGLATLSFGLYRRRFT